MIIILTNKDDVTVDFIVRELQSQNIKYYRLNTEDIPNSIELRFSLDRSEFILYDKNKGVLIDLNNVDAVYFRRAEISKLDYIKDISNQERNYLRGELAYVLEGIYKILRKKYWLNNIYSIREAENKIYQLQLAQELGFNIPKSVISNALEYVETLISYCDADCIIKPVKTGNMSLRHEIHDLPLEIAEKCIDITKKLGLNYAAIDLILDENNNYIFLECNPNGQWAWLEKRLGFPISKSIVNLLKKGCCDENT